MLILNVKHNRSLSAPLGYWRVKWHTRSKVNTNSLWWEGDVFALSCHMLWEEEVSYSSGKALVHLHHCRNPA